MSVSKRYRATALALFLGVVAELAGAQASEKALPEDTIAHAQDVETRASDRLTLIQTPRQEWEEVGMASWYGLRFHGKRTASGERFDKKALTAAHKTLPLGTWVEVLNLVNDRRVQVRINDRGPHRRGVVIDLSQAAAQALGLVHQGRASVKLSLPQFPDD